MRRGALERPLCGGVCCRRGHRADAQDAAANEKTMTISAHAIDKQAHCNKIQTRQRSRKRACRGTPRQRATTAATSRTRQQCATQRNEQQGGTQRHRPGRNSDADGSCRHLHLHFLVLREQLLVCATKRTHARTQHRATQAPIVRIRSGYGYDLDKQQPKRSQQG